ncbi:cupin domain-containing protein [Bifidobacterium pullorum subsp. saeculare]|uniref:Cupin domain-containing protein n=1 Tax=Bifidobacterium pullorum subsp. saeculare TaxID=78257 RepID=A0A938WXY4_9BIFI|nr:cupin domain-containing protein [Bifidobacterium pullorum]MBM6699946.1 cupin domain-containing protein [Bifidobacterium pullorum subsp. saeculare]
MTNFTTAHVDVTAPRTELHELLGLTGAEISINSLPAGASVPFVHSHQKNEEIYGVLAGKGKAEIDGETVELTAGDWVRIAPAGKRRFFAADDEGITYVCVQVKADSLGGYTTDDAVM